MLMHPPGTLVHPVSGELVDEASERARRVAASDADAKINEHYRAIERLRNGRTRMLEGLPIPEVPKPRYRTPKQHSLMICPNCGGRVSGPGRGTEVA